MSAWRFDRAARALLAVVSPPGTSARFSTSPRGGSAFPTRSSGWRGDLRARGARARGQAALRRAVARLHAVHLHAALLLGGRRLRGPAGAGPAGASGRIAAEHARSCSRRCSTWSGTRRATGSAPGSRSGCSRPASISPAAWFDIARVDMLSLALLMLAVLVLARSERFDALAGVLLGLAFLAKQSALVAALPLLAARVVTQRGLRRGYAVGGMRQQWSASARSRSIARARLVPLLCVRAAGEPSGRGLGQARLLAVRSVFDLAVRDGGGRVRARAAAAVALRARAASVRGRPAGERVERAAAQRRLRQRAAACVSGAELGVRRRAARLDRGRRPRAAGCFCALRATRSARFSSPGFGNHPGGRSRAAGAAQGRRARGSAARSARRSAAPVPRAHRSPRGQGAARPRDGLPRHPARRERPRQALAPRQRHVDLARPALRADRARRAVVEGRAREELRAHRSQALVRAREPCAR